MKRAEEEDALAGLTTTIPLAGQLLGLSRNKAYEAAATGQIPTLRFGKRIVVPTAPLRRMLCLEAGPTEQQGDDG